ncbi:MAG: nitroreductase family protein [Bacteroidales bacterium]|nr:nitroreductase family protein [Bacteroidales bacterium]
MNLLDLVKKTRSYRKFDESKTVERKTLEELIDLARQSASARNLQPLKYYISNTPTTNDIVFNHIAWAGYLKDGAPKIGERPTAYIIMLVDHTLTQSSPEWDEGIAAQTIMLGAREKDLGGCIIGAIKKQGLSEALSLPKHLEIALVLAIGVPTEDVRLEQLTDNGDIKYYRDEQQIHHVPKRSLHDIIINNQ